MLYEDEVIRLKLAQAVQKRQDVEKANFLYIDGVTLNRYDFHGD